MTLPEIVNARLREARAIRSTLDQGFLGLAELVTEWIEATKGFDSVMTRPFGDAVRLAAIERLDAAEIALVRAVAP